MKSILITGGAGFAGSNLAIRFKEHFPNCRVAALDNLKRRGSELSLSRLKKAGIEFSHGDVRIKEDLLELGAFELVIDCSAEPSVLAGRNGSPEYVVQTNLVGTINCLETARIHGSKIVFLSTSRVYPVDPINALSYREDETRFVINSKQQTVGASEYGISENFPLEGVRSIYGASKLCSELLLTEYMDVYGLKGVVNRCGVLTGPWQMGKIDQGVVVLWIAKHLFEKELSYIGYGGTGKQVRDMLHIDDLFQLLLLQVKNIDEYSGQVYNVGGGQEVSVSLRELTELCQRSTGKKIKITQVKENRPSDLISYISDRRKITEKCGWKPKIGPEQIVEEISTWIRNNRVALEPILA